MSQSDYTIADQDGASFLVDINAQLAAIVSNNSGATEPTTTYAYQWWADTSAGVLKQRNAANNAWINILTLSSGAVSAIPDDIVTTAKILNASVTTPKIADANVTNSKLAFDGGALGNRNILINAGFRINQRGYVSGAVLAAGAYGHDRFKAGASGGDYSFTQLNTNTQITIASGKSLIQVVEDKNVHETTYVLSWEGTAQARVGVNSATPSGAYASSPILITGQTAGTTMSVEFNTGTLGKAQLEKGTIATPFENRSYGQELALCQRYYERLFYTFAGDARIANADYSCTLSFSQNKRATPTISVISETLTNTTRFATNPTISTVENRYRGSATGSFVASNATIASSIEL